MSVKSKSCFNGCRSGLTLVEVVASIAVLSGLLTSTALAYSLHVRQVGQAQQRLRALSVADQLLTDWFASAEPVPVDAWEELPEQGLAYRTQLVRQEELHTVGGDILRLEVFASDDSEDRPLAAVEVVVPLAAPDESDEPWKLEI